MFAQSNNEQVLFDYINEIVLKILRNKHEMIQNEENLIKYVSDPPHNSYSDKESNCIKHIVSLNKEDENLNNTPFCFTSPSENSKNFNTIAAKDDIIAQESIRQKYNSLKKMGNELNNQPCHFNMDILKNATANESILEEQNDLYKKSEEFLNNNIIDEHTSIEKLNKLGNDKSGEKYWEKIRGNSKFHHEENASKNSEFENSQLTNMVFTNVSPIDYDNWENPNDLIDRLRELLGSMSMDHKEEISRILYELRKAKIIY